MAEPVLHLLQTVPRSNTPLEFPAMRATSEASRARGTHSGRMKLAARVARTKTRGEQAGRLGRQLMLKGFLHADACGAAFRPHSPRVTGYPHRRSDNCAGHWSCSTGPASSLSLLCRTHRSPPSACWSGWAGTTKMAPRGRSLALFRWPSCPGRQGELGHGRRGRRCPLTELLGGASSIEFGCPESATRIAAIERCRF